MNKKKQKQTYFRSYEYQKGFKKRYYARQQKIVRLARLFSEGLIGSEDFKRLVDIRNVEELDDFIIPDYGKTDHEKL